MIFEKTLIKCLLLREFGEYTIIMVLGQASPTAKTTGLLLSESERCFFDHLSNEMNVLDAPMALYKLLDFLSRYDVMLESLKPEDDAYILEFKVQDPDEEASLQDTVNAHLHRFRNASMKPSCLPKGFSQSGFENMDLLFKGKKC